MSWTIKPEQVIISTSDKPDVVIDDVKSLLLSLKTIEKLGIITPQQQSLIQALQPQVILKYENTPEKITPAADSSQVCYMCEHKSQPRILLDDVFEEYKEFIMLNDVMDDHPFLDSMLCEVRSGLSMTSKHYRGCGSRVVKF